MQQHSRKYFAVPLNLNSLVCVATGSHTQHVVLVRYRSSGLPTYSNGLSRPLQSVPGVCSSNTAVNADIVTLEANSSTVHWGYYYAGAAPQLVINSGDTVNVEMVRVQCRRTFVCGQA